MTPDQFSLLGRVAKGETRFRRSEASTPAEASAFDEIVENLLALRREGLLDMPEPLPNTMSSHGRWYTASPVITDRGQRALREAAVQDTTNRVESSPGIVNTSPADVLAQVRALIDKHVAEQPSRSELLAHVDELEKARGPSTATSLYLKFVSAVADETSLWEELSPYLPALQLLLTGR